jgi:hypothetical protein
MLIPYYGVAGAIAKDRDSLMGAKTFQDTYGVPVLIDEFGITSVGGVFAAADLEMLTQHLELMQSLGLLNWAYETYTSQKTLYGAMPEGVMQDRELTLETPVMPILKASVAKYPPGEPIFIPIPVTYVLDVWTVLGGTTNPTGIQSVLSGKVVTITATPALGYTFSGWQVQTGTAPVTTYPATTNPLTLTITAATVVMPLFNLVPATPTCAAGFHWDATANACVQDAQPSQAGATIAFLLLLSGITVGGVVLGSKRGKKRTQRRRR